jgi:hypothetical protein
MKIKLVKIQIFLDHLLQPENIKNYSLEIDEELQMKRLSLKFDQDIKDKS